MVTMAELREGMKVRSIDGHGVGKIIRLGAGILVIEKGLFFPKDYEVPISMVSEIRDGEACLSVSKEALEREGGFVAGEGTSLGGGATTGTSTAYEAGDERVRETAIGASPEIGTGESRAAATEETRVPLAEEELEATKRERDAGAVRVSKDVVTERRSIDVPVTREEVRVERVPTSGAEVSGDAFQEKSVVVPVKEEEVEIRKRPRVREEVRVSKTSRTVDQRADADVRREQARIERTDEADPSRGGILEPGKDDDR